MAEQLAFLSNQQVQTRRKKLDGRADFLRDIIGAIKSGDVRDLEKRMIDCRCKANEYRAEWNRRRNGGEA